MSVLTKAALFIALVTLLGACPRPNQPRPKPNEGGAPPVDNSIPELLRRQAYDTLYAQFSAKLRQALPRDALERGWTRRAQRFGPFEVAQRRPTRYWAVHTCGFAKGQRALKVHLDQAGTIVGVFFDEPGPTPLDAKPADAAAKRAFGNAAAFIGNLSRGAFVAATAHFSPKMKLALPAMKLGGLWGAIAGDRGKLSGCHASGGGSTEPFLLHHPGGDFELRVNRDLGGEIVGLFFAGGYRDPEYSTQASYEERAVTIGAAPWQLPGTLTLPRGREPLGAVVLVHGSGPNDRDETVGAAKPFRDLALGLASRGFAVLRYDKRTKVHGGQMKQWPTLDEETVDDAVAAVALLKGTDGVGGDVPVFVAGHSMGGTLVPRIARRDRSITGFIILAGSTQPLEDMIERQVAYIAAADGDVSEKERARITQVKAQAARVRARKYSAKTPAAELLGIPPARWRQWQAYSAVAEVVRIERPLLVLQGERDYQVTMKDYAGWKEALEGKKWATLRSFPKLNHLFIAGEGKSTPAEYDDPGNVSSDVIDTLLSWLKVQLPR